MDLEPERLLTALRRIRIGRVATPQDRVKTKRATNDPAAAGLYLKATVPEWLIGSLEQGAGRPRSKLSVFTASQEDELWAVLSVQRSAARLRLVLPLDDSGAQHFLRQGLRGGALALALETDEGDLSAMVDLGLPLADARALERLLQRARCLPGSLTRLVQFVEARSSGTLMSGARADTTNGTDVVVLISNRANNLAGAPHDQRAPGFDTP